MPSSLAVFVSAVLPQSQVLSNVENISDFSYAWEIMNDFTKTIHDKVQEVCPPWMEFFRGSFNVLPQHRIL